MRLVLVAETRAVLTGTRNDMHATDTAVFQAFPDGESWRVGSSIVFNRVIRAAPLAVTYRLLAFGPSFFYGEFQEKKEKKCG